MALSIKDPEADRLVRQLTNKTGETITQAIVVALRERLARVTRQSSAPTRRKKLQALWREIERLPVLDNRSADEIIGYDDDGAPR